MTSRNVLPPHERAEAIVDAATSVYAAKGLSRTTVADVARAAHVTRGLVYHYFPEPDDLVDAVLDRLVAQFVDDVRAWDESRTVGAVGAALDDVVRLFRRQVRHHDPLRIDLRRVENAALYQRFIDRAVTAVVDRLQLTTVEDYARRHRIEISHVRETFVVLVHGLVALARVQPDVGDDVLAAVVRQVLRLDVLGEVPSSAG